MCVCVLRGHPSGTGCGSFSQPSLLITSAYGGARRCLRSARFAPSLPLTPIPRSHNAGEKHMVLTQVMVTVMRWDRCGVFHVTRRPTGSHMCRLQR